MFRFICKNLLIQQHRTSNVRYLQSMPSLNLITKPTEEQSLTVSFLTNSCGLSFENAISASKLVKIENTEKPNSVIQLLTSHGFTKSHVATLVSKNPSIIVADPEKSLRPKIEYFESVGISGPYLPKFICSNGLILRTSLENRIIPNFEFLRGFVQTNENLVLTLKRSTRVVSCNVEKLMVPNINTLRAHGVPEPLITRAVMVQPQMLIVNVDLFTNMVVVIKEMGFEPVRMSFILAIMSMSRISKEKWESKKKICMGFGWSESEFHLAFRKQPMFVLSSEKKISNLMDFFVREVGLKPSDVAKCPNILLLSLERRIIPRWSVLKFLISKNLLKKDVNVASALNVCKKEFEKFFVTNYMDDTPEVMRVYLDGLDSKVQLMD